MFYIIAIFREYKKKTLKGIEFYRLYRDWCSKFTKEYWGEINKQIKEQR